MKIKTLAISMLAFLGVVTACQNKPEDLGPAGIKVDKSELTFTSAAGSQTVSLLATRDWTVSSDVEWVVCSPSEGAASKDNQKVEVSVLSNPGYDRTTTLVFSIGLSTEVVTISQAGDKGQPKKGDGTKENPYSASEARDLALNGTPSADYVYIHGFITKISTAESAISQYGNHNFYICDTAEADENDFYCFQVYDLGKVKFTDFNKIKVGDEVVVCGKVTNYNGTPETVGKGDAYLYSLNGETSGSTGGGTEVDYDNAPALSVQELINKADENTYYKLTGKVSSFNATYCSFDLTDDSGKIYVYSVDNKDEWKTVIENGGTVTLAGKYLYYASKSQHEVVNAHIISFTAGGSQGGDTPAEPKVATVAEFIAAAESNTQPYKLTGTIGGSINTTYGNFDLTDATGTVYVYGLTATNLGYGAKNDQSYASLGLNEGDEVTLIGYRGSYNDKIEVVNAYYVSHKAGGQGGDNPGGGTTPDDAISLADFLASDDNTQATVANVFVAALTTKGYVITDGKDNVYVYANSTPSVKIGDKIHLAGTKTTYYGLPEITSPTTTAVSSGNKVPYPGVQDITKTFDTYESTKADYITFTATVAKDGNYTNFKVEGATARVGSLSSAPSSMYDGLNEGDKVQVTGFFNTFNTSKTPNLLSVIAVSVTKDGENPGGGDQGGDNPGAGDASEYTSNVTWTLGANAYDKTSSTPHTAVVNNVTVDNVLKLGTSKNVGDATITLPKGTKKVTFYGVAWTGKTATLVGTVGDTEVLKQALAGNAGATGNPVFNLTVSASDKYTKTFDAPLAADTQVKITTDSAVRVILFGIKAE